MSDDFTQKDLIKYLIKKIDLIDEKLDKVEGSYREINTKLRNYNHIWEKVDAAYKKIQQIEIDYKDEIEKAESECRDEIEKIKTRVNTIETTERIGEKWSAKRIAIISAISAVGAVIVSIIKVFIS